MFTVFRNLKISDFLRIFVQHLNRKNLKSTAFAEAFSKKMIPLLLDIFVPFYTSTLISTVNHKKISKIKKKLQPKITTNNPHKIDQNLSAYDCSLRNETRSKPIDANLFATTIPEISWKQFEIAYFLCPRQTTSQRAHSASTPIFSRNSLPFKQDPRPNPLTNAVSSCKIKNKMRVKRD